MEDRGDERSYRISYRKAFVATTSWCQEYSMETVDSRMQRGHFVFIVNKLTARQWLVAYTFTPCLRCSTRACTYTAINNSQMSGQMATHVHIHIHKKGERREREGETREGGWLGD